MNSDPMQQVKDSLIMAVLPEIPFSGWSKAALVQATRTLGLDATMAERAFPDGVIDAVLHLIDLADRRMAEDAKSAGLSEMRLTARIRWLVRHRLESWVEHREAIRRASVVLSLPGNAAKAAKSAWATADLMWHLAGDETVDFTYYTKRVSLSAVYSSTLVCWMSDESEGFAQTWAFLDRRLAEVSQLPKVINAVRTQIDQMTKPIENFLASAGRRKGGGRHFGLKRT